MGSLLGFRVLGQQTVYQGFRTFHREFWGFRADFRKRLLYGFRVLASKTRFLRC